MLNNVVITMFGASWEISKGILCKVYDCVTTRLHIQNQYIIKNEQK